MHTQHNIPTLLAITVGSNSIPMPYVSHNADDVVLITRALMEMLRVSRVAIVFLNCGKFPIAPVTAANIPT